jgi:hypothetical protein
MEFITLFLSSSFSRAHDVASTCLCALVAVPGFLRAGVRQRGGPTAERVDTNWRRSRVCAHVNAHLSVSPVPGETGVHAADHRAPGYCQDNQEWQHGW